MSGEAVAVVAVLLGLYLLWVWRYPWKPCPRCGGSTREADRQGNYRITECRRCGGAPYPRFFARLMGRD